MSTRPTLQTLPDGTLLTWLSRPALCYFRVIRSSGGYHDTASYQLRWGLICDPVKDDQGTEWYGGVLHLTTVGESFTAAINNALARESQAFSERAETSCENPENEEKE